MEFWAVEVKSGEPVKVVPGEDMVLHLSQASLGESKKDKGNESVCLFVNVDGKKLVLATLFSDKLPQQQLDLVFDNDFELSHNWKNGSVYFFGYKARSPFEDEDEMGEFASESDEEIPLTIADNGKPETKVKEDKPAEAKKAIAEKDSAAGKQKVKIVEPNLDLKQEEDDDSSDEDDSMSEDEDGSMDEDEDESDSDGDDESDESDEEETPKKVETGKKRAANSAVKTPAPEKKAKVTTPQKTDGKKGSVHVATPYPSKQAVKKTPANKNQQTPKSGGGTHACKSCSKTFNSEGAVESHTKAKHSAGK